MFTAVALTQAPAPAAARRASALSGHSGFALNVPCVSWDPGAGNNGIALSRSAATACAGSFVPAFFQIPVHLDTSGSKTVALTLKVPTANVVECGLIEHDLAGNVVETVVYDPFPAGSSYITRSETISIATNNNLFVRCGYNHSNPAVEGIRLLSIAY